MKPGKVLVALFALSLVLSVGVVLNNNRNLHAQTPEKKAEVDFSKIDWDEEETKKEDAKTSPIDLQNTNWDEEETKKEDAKNSPIDLQNTNWDEEESNQPAGATSEVNLQNTNWDEDSTEETASDDAFAPPIRKVSAELTEGELAFIHWTGGFLFLLYLSGSFLTGYFLRHTKLATKCPPEVLILLHIFWPLEWILFPFFKKTTTPVI